jgi:hypothetical protein
VHDVELRAALEAQAETLRGLCVDHARTIQQMQVIVNQMSWEIQMLRQEMQLLRQSHHVTPWAPNSILKPQSMILPPPVVDEESQPNEEFQPIDSRCWIHCSYCTNRKLWSEVCDTTMGEGDRPNTTLLVPK